MVHRHNFFSLSKSLIIVCAMALVLQPTAFASPGKVKKVQKELRDYRRLQAQIKRDSAKLSDTEKSQIKAAAPQGLEDSDGDGVPDVIETDIDNTNQCDAGSHDGGTEVEAQGTVDSITGSTFTVSSKSFVTSSDTQYEGGDASALIVGACVEVQGQTVAGSSDNTAVKIEFKDSSECTND